MSENYKPGDVVRIRYGDVDQIGLVRKRKEAGGALEVAYASGGYDMLATLLADEDDVRSLVALDPEDREAAETFVRGYLGIHQYSKTPWDDRAQESRDLIVSAVLAGFAALANPRPPKPDEPTGLGAVVEDVDGFIWVRLCADVWACSNVDNKTATTWETIPVARVLSEGVTA